MSSRSFLLTDLSWMEVRSHIAHDARLIVPIGACDQYGPHLPIGASTVVAEAVAAALSRDFGVLRAPAIAYGVNLPAERQFGGAASLREKTLHRLINDLLASWEDHGFTEFILITAQSYIPHVEAIATATGTTARIRVIDLLDIDFSEHLRGERLPQHGGEVLTSLMLYLDPDKVNMDAAEDLPASAIEGSPIRLTELPARSLGCVGYPSYASRETGERIFAEIVRRIRSKVFLVDGDDDD
jgi:creatinine amidohydrolase